MRPLPILGIGLLIGAPLQAQVDQRKLPASTAAAAPRPEAVPSVKVASSLSWADGWMRDGERKELPFIHEIRALAVGTTSFTAHLSGPVYVDLTDAELALLPGLSTVPAEVEIRTSLGMQRKVPQALVDIYPYRRNTVTGRVERLSSYTLEFAETRNGAAGQRKSATYPAHSKLSTGEWYRFTVPQDGVYELSYDFLQRLGVDMADLSSDRINIYGNHEGALPFTNTPRRPTDLKLNDVQVEDGGDGLFGPGDRLLFFATGAQDRALNAAGTRFVHTKNVYSDSASYFVGIGIEAPARISERAQSTLPATDHITVFNDHQVIDRDAVNLLKSGRTFFGETYDLVTNYNYRFPVPFLHAEDSAYLTVEVMARTIGTASSSFRVVVGSANSVVTMPGVNGSSESAYGVLRNVTIPLRQTGNDLLVSTTFNKADPVTSLGYMNYLELNARRDLKMADDQLLFRDLATVGAGRVGEFTLDLATGTKGIWEVTDPTRPGRIDLTDTGAQRIFRMATDSVREYVAFRSSGLLQPTPIGRVPNQDLHATVLPTDLVIVCPPQFMGEAARLADRRASEGLSVVIVTPQQVFNEFSSGQRDATAIKRYMKMLYDRASNDPLLMPRYLLLFGDGSYNNISLAPGNQNLVPTYQSMEALRPGNSYTADDYFGLLDDGEGEATNDLVDIGIGRLPVSDAQQARQVVDKILHYDGLDLLSGTLSNCNSGNNGGTKAWRNLVVFCSDDQDGDDAGDQPYHTTNSEVLANKVKAEHPCLDQDKIFLDAYPQATVLGGQRYPEAENDLREAVQRGCLLVNYVGHGGEVGWAHERLLDNATILGWTNLNRLPLFMTATCEFSRWDDPVRTSAGENVFLNPNGGGIALLTTTRIAYVQPNQAISMHFYDHVFAPVDEMDRPQRLGDIFRRTKVESTPASATAQPYHRNFSLLGDPSLRLALPHGEARITAITDSLGNAMDVLQALDLVQVQGEVLGPDGNVDIGFNGIVIPTVYDKEANLMTLANDAPASPLPFTLRKNIIHRGKSSVVDGKFKFTFVVPKDINYQVGPGRIGVYAESMSTNACGYTNDPLVGGTNPDAVADDQGPRIELYLNDERFVPGGITNENPLLFAKLYDDNGINTLGSSIGHDLVATVDANSENPIVLNDVYESDQDTYKSGQVRYRLSNVAEGHHTLDLKAWDVFNNSNQKSTEFVVAPLAELALEHVLNYPNPFTTHTEFYFEHNRPCTTLECQVQVFTVGGRLVKTLSRHLECDGFRSEPLAWDGLDDHGDRIGRGVYVYRLSIATAAGESADTFEKLVILR